MVQANRFYQTASTSRTPECKASSVRPSYWVVGRRSRLGRRLEAWAHGAVVVVVVTTEDVVVVHAAEVVVVAAAEVVVVASAEVVVVAADEVVVVAADEVVVEVGLRGQVGSDTTILTCWRTVQTDVSEPARARAWTCCGVRFKPKIWLSPSTTDSTFGLLWRS